MVDSKMVDGLAKLSFVLLIGDIKDLYKYMKYIYRSLDIPYNFCLVTFGVGGNLK